jgi:hypothetical protein
VVFGYTRIAVTSQRPGVALIDAPLHAALGTITEVHPRSRGTAQMYNFPCFETDAYVGHGLSGGPAISERGDVIGVVSSCLPDAKRPHFGTTRCALAATLLGPGVSMVDGTEVKLSQMDFLPLVKAYPALSKTYGEVSSSQGARTARGWRR